MNSREGSKVQDVFDSELWKIRQRRDSKARYLTSVHAVKGTNHCGRDVGRIECRNADVHALLVANNGFTTDDLVGKVGDGLVK